MNTKMSVNRIALLLLGASLLAASVACGPPEKSKELVELERHLKDPKAREVKEAPGASKPYREARQYRRLALEHWEDGNQSLSREYAILGSLKYRTAEAIKDQVEAMKRLEKANAMVAGANPEIKTLNQEQLKLADEVGALEREVAQVRRKKEEAERRRKAMANRGNDSSSPKDAALMSKLRNKIAEAERARQDARDVNAREHAPEKFNPADNQLKSVKSMLASDDEASEQMIADADNAIKLFKQARAAAEPKHEEQVAKSKPAVRRSNLRDEASNAFGGTYVIHEAAGARIVLAGIFRQGSSSVNPNSRRMLEQLAKLAEKYDEFTIFIEGYTSKRGDATENLGLSQLRAKAVEKFLTGEGIQASRIDTKGQGQDQPRFPGDAARNERVEVLMTR